MNTHDLTITKRIKNTRSAVPTRANPIACVEADSKAVCSCGWSSDWYSTEQLAREDYGKHLFMSVKSPLLGKNHTT